MAFLALYFIYGSASNSGAPSFLGDLDLMVDILNIFFNDITKTWNLTYSNNNFSYYLYYSIFISLIISINPCLFTIQAHP